MHQIFIAKLFNPGPQWTQTIKAALPGIKSHVLGLIFGVLHQGQLRLIPYFRALPFEFLAKRRTLILCPISMCCVKLLKKEKKIVLQVVFFVIVFFSRATLLCVFCVFTMIFSHVQEMRGSMVTWLKEAKVHLSLKIKTWWQLTYLLYPNSSMADANSP